MRIAGMIGRLLRSVSRLAGRISVSLRIVRILPLIVLLRIRLDLETLDSLGSDEVVEPLSLYIVSSCDLSESPCNRQAKRKQKQKQKQPRSFN